MSAPLQRRVAEAAARRRLPGDTTCFRLVNAEADGLPGLTVDWFDGVAVISAYRELPDAEAAALAAALRALPAPARAVYLKRRPKEARVVASTRRHELAPEAPLAGDEVVELPVRERGLTFLIRPGQGLSVGLYLDARDARAWVQSHAARKAVLNCFAYTCGFGVAAMAGGATRAVNIDVSRKVLEWGQQNARANGQPAQGEDFIAGDVFDWLGRLGKKGQRFDLVILDPPSFATTRSSRFSAASDYPALVEKAAKVVSAGGTLLCCCNLATLPRERLETQVLKGVAGAGREGTILARFGASAVDFPPVRGGRSALQILAVEVR